MKKESKLKIEHGEIPNTKVRSIHLLKKKTTLKVKQEEDSEHEGTFGNKEDTMERKEIMIPVFDGEDYSMWKKSITYIRKRLKGHKFDLQCHFQQTIGVCV